MLWIVKNTLRKIKSLLPENQGRYRIAEINIRLQEVVFHVRNKGVFLRCSLSEAIADAAIINDLKPWEACWLGGYFGRALRVSLEKGSALKKAKSMSFLLQNDKGLYKIMFQNRDGNIGYINKRTGQEFVEHPLVIVNTEHIITNFGSSQACYLGIIAGISIEKAISFDQKTGDHTLDRLLSKRPKLRIIE